MTRPAEETDDHVTEYRETCGCGRVLLTTKQANGHTAACDQLPEDSLLTGEF